MIIWEKRKKKPRNDSRCTLLPKTRQFYHSIHWSDDFNRTKKRCRRCVQRKKKNDGIEDIICRIEMSLLLTSPHTDARTDKEKHVENGWGRKREWEGFSEWQIKIINWHDLLSVVIRVRLVVCSLQLDSVFPLVCQGDHLLRVLQLCSLRSLRPVTVRMWAGDSIDVDIDNRHYDGDWYNFHSCFEDKQKSSGEDSQHDELPW